MLLSQRLESVALSESAFTAIGGGTRQGELMKIFTLALLCCALCRGQATNECRPSTVNVPGAQYPCVYPDHRATFRLIAPDAQKVQVRVGRQIGRAHV